MGVYRATRANSPCAPVVDSKHQLARARELMSQERFASFSFPASPGLGVYVHEVFIAAKQFKLEGNVAGDVIAAVGDGIDRLPGTKLAVRGKGDGRKHAKAFAPERVRAFAVLDFERGSGYLVANHSTVRIQTKFKHVVGPTLTKTLYNHSFSARSVTTDWKGGNNWVDAAWVTRDTFRLRYGLRASGPGGTLIINTIDHQLLIDRRSGAVTFEGDRFPSTGTYRSDCAGATQTMHRQFEAALANLGDDPAFSYDAPFNSAAATLGTLSNCTYYGGTTFYADRRCRSNKARFIMQGDGNLVVKDEFNKVRWHSHTYGNPGARTVFQRDGNLVVYSASGRRLWHAGTFGNSGAILVVQDDGNVVIYRSNGSAAWATNTQH